MCLLQQILNKFEFFPIKCKVLKATDAFKKAADIGKRNKTFRTKASSENWSEIEEEDKKEYVSKREGLEDRQAEMYTQ